MLDSVPFPHKVIIRPRIYQADSYRSLLVRLCRQFGYPDTHNRDTGKAWRWRYLWEDNATAPDLEVCFRQAHDAMLAALRFQGQI